VNTRIQPSTSHAQNVLIWVASNLIGIGPTPAPNGGYLRADLRPAPVTERDLVSGPAWRRIADYAA